MYSGTETELLVPEISQLTWKEALSSFRRIPDRHLCPVRAKVQSRQDLFAPVFPYEFLARNAPNRTHVFRHPGRKQNSSAKKCVVLECIGFRHSHFHGTGIGRS